MCNQKMPIAKRLTTMALAKPLNVYEFVSMMPFLCRALRPDDLAIK